MIIHLPNNQSLLFSIVNPNKNWDGYKKVILSRFFEEHFKSTCEVFNNDLQG
jgi:hypothetical protein